MIYLDNAATTPVCPEALAAFNDACRDAWGNPSSGHAVGRAARALLERSRETVAGALGVPPGDVVFTSGGTESIHLALRGTAAAHGRHKKHIVTTTLEHAAVHETLKALQQEGFSVTEVPPGADGRVDIDAVCNAVREDTFLCAATLVCSETGAVLDMEKLYRQVKAKNPACLVFVDGVQGFLRIDNEDESRMCDLYALSGHKIHAPRGVGALYVRDGVRIAPQTVGGGQEHGLRAGTEPVALCAALAAAVTAWRPLEEPDLLETIVNCQLSTVNCIVIPGHSSYILSVAFPGLPGEVLMRALSDKGVCVGIGSACSSGGKARRDKRILRSLKLPAPVIEGAVRLSVSRFTTRDEVARAAEIIRETVQKLRT